MFRNFFKIAFRNQVRGKAYSFINMAGLSIGMTVTILIGLWIWSELSYNRNFDNYGRIAQVMQNRSIDGDIQTWNSAPMQMGPELSNKYGANFRHVVMSGWTSNHLLTVGDKNLNFTGNYMDIQAPDLLSLKMLSGTRRGLADPSSVLLSQSAAKAGFGNDDPVNKMLKIDNNQIVKVTGVYQDIPSNSSFGDLKFIAPWQLLVSSENFVQRQIGWGNSWFQLFVTLNDNVDIATASARIKDVTRSNVSGDELKFKPEVILHPMSRWWLYSEFKHGISTGGRIRNVWLFGIIGIFVLLLACINFMNLSTARSEKRSKEVGIRKAIGSLRSQLVKQFFIESIVVAFISFAISLALVEVLLPRFNEVSGRESQIPWSSPAFWIVGVGFSMFTGLIAGSYPALYLSSFNAVSVLKGTFKVGRMASMPRKVLVVLQFTVSITLIICTIVVFRQIQFAKNRPLGFNRNGLLSVPIKAPEINAHFEALQTELLNTGVVNAVSRSESTATNSWVTNSGFEWQGKDPGMQDVITTVGVSHDFGKTISWTIKNGRDFSTSYPTDSSGFVLNEEAVKYMGFKNPIGENIKAFGSTYHVIGVVRDMVMQSPYDPIRPMVFYIDTYNRVNFINIKMDPRAGTSAALASIEKIFKKYDAANSFEFKFADEEFDAKFREEKRIGSLSTFFSALAILISCLGLFGMASFSAERRTKEIGVRKVLGASVLKVWSLLSFDFILLVLIAIVVATPLAYYFMNSWLQNFQYRTGVGWWIFAATGTGAVLITLITVSFQSIRAALANPVKSLRSE